MANQERSPQETSTVKPDFQGIEPFRFWIWENFHPTLTPNEQRMAIATQEWEVSYDNDTEHRKKTARRVESMEPAIRDAINRLRHPTTVKIMTEATGIEGLEDDPTMHGGGLHYSAKNSFLQAHVDYERHPTIPDRERRLNLILFLHCRWEPSWGGKLQLCDMHGKPRFKINPTPGMLVAFECGPSSMHSVQVINSDEAHRLSCAIYYLAPARPTATRTRALFVPNRSRTGIPEEVQ